MPPRVQPHTWARSDLVLYGAKRGGPHLSAMRWALNSEMGVGCEDCRSRSRSYLPWTTFTHTDTIMSLHTHRQHVTLYIPLIWRVKGNHTLSAIAPHGRRLCSPKIVRLFEWDGGVEK